MNNESQISKFKKKARSFPYWVLTVSLLFTCWVTYYIHSVDQAKSLVRFTNSVQESKGALQDFVNTYSALLRGASGLFSASEEVTAAEFRTYVERLRIPEFYPGIRGLGFAQRVLPEERQKVTQHMRESGQTNFTIWPEGERDQYFPIVYLEPLDNWNARALGYDTYSDEIRRDAMLRAIHQGFSVSGIVNLVQDSQNPTERGFMIYLSAYRGPEVPKSDLDRRNKLLGFVYSPFRASDFFTKIFEGKDTSLINLEAYDGEQTPKNLLYKSPLRSPAKPMFRAVESFPIGGRVWTLVYRSTPEFEQTLQGSHAMGIFFGGLVISLGIFGVTVFIARAWERTERSEFQLLSERERLRASEELHRTISETAADAIVTIDEANEIISVNRAAERIFGYPPEEMLGRDFSMLVPERMRTGNAFSLKDFLSRGKQTARSRLEMFGRHKNGGEIPLEISFGEISTGNKRIFTGIIRDITERKKAEEQIRDLNRDLERRVSARTAELQEANSQMEAFVYSIAHDLRAPLRAMRGFAQVLNDDYASSLDEQARDYTKRIVSSAKFMDDLINDLLAFSRITRSQVELSPISLDAALLQVRQQLAPEIREKKAEIEVVGALPIVLAHEATLRQVITNLLSNSLKFVSPGIQPVIKIHSEDAGLYWRVWIEDNGIGIAPEYRKRIFGIFERLHGGAYSGTGIGLAIVRKGIERMSGKVGVESELGKGSRFWFELPKAAT